MFEGDRTPIEGRHHRLAEPINVPPPLSRPRIMVGGGGERKTLRLVAEYADACNILVPDPGESRHKLEVLARHCEAIGRDVTAIETTALLEADLRSGRQTPADVVAAFRAQADEGIQHVIVNLPDAHVIERLETFGREIIPAVA
jgi:alkanesulfonate monooxygenase SsuD/methylene tetrahydromethanopterin reductase-like flavin-dependent oxidoreductase (luciferase family)